jgi:hypothetical protein
LLAKLVWSWFHSFSPVKVSLLYELVVVDVVVVAEVEMSSRLGG